MITTVENVDSVQVLGKNSRTYLVIGTERSYDQRKECPCGQLGPGVAPQSRVAKGERGSRHVVNCYRL